MASCEREKVIDELNDWKNGKPGIPGAEARILSIEGKLKDNGELGMETKISKMWSKYSNSELNKAGIFKIVLALIQSGLLVVIVTMLLNAWP